MNRRQILASLTCFGGAAAVKGYASIPNPPSTGEIPSTVLNPRSFGAVGDGNALDSSAINAAIDACNEAGGGIVYLSPGNYLSGTVVLKSNVTLYILRLERFFSGARMSPTTIRNLGQIQTTMPDKGISSSLAMRRMSDSLGPARSMDKGAATGLLRIANQFLTIKNGRMRSTSIGNIRNRVSPMIELVNCTNLRIEDIRIRGAPGWTIRPINCTNVVIQGIAIKNPVYGPNTDGIDMTGCKNLLVSDCIIDTGDDAICLKSEKPLRRFA